MMVFERGKMNKIIKNISVGCLGLSLCSMLMAKDTGDIKVSVETLAGCVINSDNINFGVISVQPNKTIDHNGGSFNVQCSKGISYKIVSDSGITEENRTRYIKNLDKNEQLRYELFGVYPDGTKQLMLGTGSYWGGFNVSNSQNQGQVVTFGLTATIYTDTSIVSEGQYQDDIALDVIY